MLKDNIKSILNEIKGEFGIYFEDLQSDEKVVINPNVKFSAASTIKIPLVALALKECEEGKYDLNQEFILKEENRVGGTGILKTLNKNYKPTMLDLINLAIVVSDNVATNELVDLVGGFDKINSFNESIGAPNTKFKRKMMDLKALQSGKDNFTTAEDLGHILKLIAKGECVSKKTSKMVLDIMKTQQFRQKLPHLLPAITSYDPKATDEFPEEGKVIVANKTGDLWKVQHDVGIFILPGKEKYVLAIYSQKLDEDSEGIEAISKISKVIYEYMSEKYK